VSTALARALRVLTVVVFGLVAVLAFRAVRDRQTRPPERAQTSSTERTVPQAMATLGTAPLTVRGFVFDGGGTGLRMCAGRIRHSPPRCLGPFLDLYGTDRGFFDMARGTDLGRTVWWSKEAVALYGTVVGTRMDVAQIFR
jgi:hypothetical protein